MHSAISDHVQIRLSIGKKSVSISAHNFRSEFSEGVASLAS